MTVFLYTTLFTVLSAYKGAPMAFDLAAREELLSPESCPSQLKRTLFGIVWSCVSTTVHGLLSIRTFHREVNGKPDGIDCSLMFWMVVAPELVLAWAVRQFFAAKDIRDTYNESHPGASSHLNGHHRHPPHCRINRLPLGHTPPRS